MSHVFAIQWQDRMEPWGWDTLAMWGEDREEQARKSWVGLKEELKAEGTKLASFRLAQVELESFVLSDLRATGPDAEKAWTVLEEIDA